MASLLLAHDLGTSGDKATVFNTDGALITSCTIPYKTVFDAGNIAEQEPADWWSAVCEASRKIAENCDVRDIAVVCLSGQMMGCLIVDGKGHPLHPHLLYCDQRAVVEAQILSERIGMREFFSITGHRPSPSYSIEKLMWLRTHQPGIFKQTRYMLNAKDYINFLLTDRIVMDYNDASGTNAFDLDQKVWSSQILDAAEIDRRLLPEVVPSTAIIGHITNAASKATGLVAGTPVVAGAGDGGCATVGIGSVRSGVTYLYLGSSSWISTSCTKRIPDPEMKLFTWAHPVQGLLQPCGTMQTAAGAYNWALETFGAAEQAEAARVGVQVHAIIEDAARKVAPGSGGLLFHPYLLGERSPHWNPLARGSFIGLRMEHGRKELYRAVFEGVAMNLGIILDCMRADMDISEIRAIGGGVRSPLWRSILADVLGVPIIASRYPEEATSMGAALIGAVGVGLVPSFRKAEEFVQLTERIEPDPNHQAVYRELRKVFLESYDALTLCMNRLDAITKR